MVKAYKLNEQVNEPLALSLAPLYTLGLNDITQDCHVTGSFEVTSQSNVMYRDVLATHLVTVVQNLFGIEPKHDTH